MKIFNQNKYKFEIETPEGIKEEWFAKKVRFVGNKDIMCSFSRQIRKILELKDGDKVKLSKLTLKVSDYITDERNKENLIELPKHAWGIMACKFHDVLEGYDSNPFDFNDCGYIDNNPFDIGIEIEDIPLTDELVLELPHLKVFKSEWRELYILIEDTELFDFIEDYLTEDCGIDNIQSQQSHIVGKSRYRVYLQPELEKKLTSELKKLNVEEIEEIWKLNNK
jgi:hypothetical protein